DVLQGQVVQSDRVAVAATAASLQRAAAASRAGTHGPAWSAVRALPWLGANVGAVQTVSEVIDSLALGHWRAAGGPVHPGWQGRVDDGDRRPRRAAVAADAGRARSADVSAAGT